MARSSSSMTAVMDWSEQQTRFSTSRFLKGLVQPFGELPRIRAPAAMAAREVRDWNAEPLGKGERRPARRLLSRRLACGADDPGRDGPECIEVGHICTDLPDLVGDEQLEVPTHPSPHLLALRRRRDLLHLFAVLRPAFLAHGAKDAHWGEGSLRTVGLGDGGDPRPPMIRVRQEL